MISKFRILAIVLALWAPRDCWAWGDEGHKVICEIAFRVAQPGTRAEIQRLITTDTEFHRFSDSCIWPDHPRKRTAEHFVNLARDSRGLTDEACPRAQECVLSAIQVELAYLNSNGGDDEAKLAALKFLGHWVGDVHQPLHVSFEDDRGGNNISVTGECRGNLHSAWDTCLVLKAVGEDVDQAATELMKTITPARIDGWTHSKPMDWANESFAIAEQARTEYCIRQGASCNHPAGKVNIDAAYVVVNTPIIREQLQKAGVRLAHMLDTTLGK
jgi:S1/P1 Nuclease